MSVMRCLELWAPVACLSMCEFSQSLSVCNFTCVCFGERGCVTEQAPNGKDPFALNTEVE